MGEETEHTRGFNKDWEALENTVYTLKPHPPEQVL